jgi:hypothetical protein
MATTGRELATEAETLMFFPSPKAYVPPSEPANQ